MPQGSWAEIRREAGVSYRWPDGNVDEYTDFVTYRGGGDFAGLTLALGYLAAGDVAGFVKIAGGETKRGITWFFPADDFASTGERVSMIRGGGPRGRSGFRPGDALPTAYQRLRTAVRRERKAGKWNVLAVVAGPDDRDTMLLHTPLQARLRGVS